MPEQQYPLGGAGAALERLALGLAAATAASAAASAACTAAPTATAAAAASAPAAATATVSSAAAALRLPLRARQVLRSSSLPLHLPLHEGCPCMPCMRTEGPCHGQQLAARCGASVACAEASGSSLKLVALQRWHMLVGAACCWEMHGQHMAYAQLGGGGKIRGRLTVVWDALWCATCLQAAHLAAGDFLADAALVTPRSAASADTTAAAAAALTLTSPRVAPAALRGELLRALQQENSLGVWGWGGGGVGCGHARGGGGS